MAQPNVATGRGGDALNGVAVYPTVGLVGVGPLAAAGQLAQARVTAKPEVGLSVERAAENLAVRQSFRR